MPFTHLSNFTGTSLYFQTVFRVSPWQAMAGGICPLEYSVVQYITWPPAQWYLVVLLLILSLCLSSPSILNLLMASFHAHCLSWIPPRERNFLHSIHLEMLMTWSDIHSRGFYFERTQRKSPTPQSWLSHSNLSASEQGQWGDHPLVPDFFWKLSVASVKRQVNCTAPLLPVILLKRL
jgi:hypothetical protein